MRSPLRRRVTPSVPLELRVESQDGSSFELHLRLSCNLNATALVEEKTGISIFDIWNDLNTSKASILLWAFIQEDHEEYQGDEGLKALRSYLSIADVPKIVQAAQEAYLLSLPKEQAEKLKKMAEEIARGEKVEAPLAETPVA